MQMGLKIEGMGELIEQMTQMGIEMDAVAAEVLPHAAEPILEQAQQNVHSRSGALSGALKIGPVKKSGTGSKVTIGVHRSDWGGEKYYPAYVEMGHGGPHPAPPHPYIRTAFDARSEEAFDILRSEIAQKLK